MNTMRLPRRYMRFAQFASLSGICIIATIISTSCLLLVSNYPRRVSYNTLLYVYERENVEEIYTYIGLPDNVIPYPTRDGYRILQYRESESYTTPTRTEQQCKENYRGRTYCSGITYGGETVVEECNLDIIIDTTNTVDSWTVNGKLCYTTRNVELLLAKCQEKLQLQYSNVSQSHIYTLCD